MILIVVLFFCFDISPVNGPYLGISLIFPEVLFILAFSCPAVISAISYNYAYLSNFGNSLLAF